jgi:hypothetical protein
MVSNEKRDIYTKIFLHLFLQIINLFQSMQIAKKNRLLQSQKCFKYFVNFDICFFVLFCFESAACKILRGPRGQVSHFEK